MSAREKFSDPILTAKGDRRAWVAPDQLKTLWFNTGTLCNLTCSNCYIESSPKNDRLVYISRAEVETFLDEISQNKMGTEEIGLTGGEPFMNPEIIEIIGLCLERGFQVLCLTNATLPLLKKIDELSAVRKIAPEHLTMRVSLDHYCEESHDKERGRGSFKKAIEGLKELHRRGFQMDIAGRLELDQESEENLRRGYADLFRSTEVELNAQDPKKLVLFPEMKEQADVPEITTECWGILNKDPKDIMCASSRMVVKRKGDQSPKVLACTLIAYDQRFEMGESLDEAWKPVSLNHSHCSKFCVLGGSSCS